MLIIYDIKNIILYYLLSLIAFITSLLPSGLPTLPQLKPILVINPFRSVLIATIGTPSLHLATNSILPFGFTSKIDLILLPPSEILGLPSKRG